MSKYHYKELQEFAHINKNKLTKTRPNKHVMSAPYYIIYENGKIIAAFNLEEVAFYLGAKSL